VLITASANLSSGIQALKRGALNYLEKPFRARDMIDAISEALQISRARQSENIAHRDFHQRLQQLSSDEYAVLVGIATGQTNAKIADRIDVSLRTLQFRRGEMMRKMGVASKEELMHLIFRVGWNPPA
jgi:FixJ family two-component response regulator